jgi:hypothetical protein
LNPKEGGPGLLATGTGGGGAALLGGWSGAEVGVDGCELCPATVEELEADFLKLGGGGSGGPVELVLPLCSGIVTGIVIDNGPEELLNIPAKKTSCRPDWYYFIFE